MSVRKKLIKVTIVATAVAMTLVGCSGNAEPSASNSGAPAKLAKVTIATTITGANFLAVSAAVDQGFFKKHGVEPEIVSVSSSDAASAAAISGQADLASLLADKVVSVASAGGDLKLVSALLKDIQFSLISTPDIKKIEDLKGKTVAIQGAGGSGYIVKYALEDAGMGLADTNIVSLGAQTAQLAALQANSVQAAALVPPYDIQAEAAGLNRLVKFSELLPNLPTASIAASSKALKEKPKAIRAFLAAQVEGAQWVVKNPDQAAQLLAKVSSIPLDQATAALKETLPLISTTGVIDKKGMLEWRDLGKKYGDVKGVDDITTTFDNSFLPKS